MSQTKSTKFNCFSPPVMLATLTIESCLAAYTAWRYKLTNITKLAIGMLLFLATFQLAEYHVCTGPGAEAIPWSRLGFVAITALPPLGLHILHVLAGKQGRRLVYGAYAVMAGFMTFFLLAPTAFTGHQCTGNYVIFQFSEKVTGIYSIYYYGWLLTSLVLGFRWANELKAEGKKALPRLQTVQGLILGYLIFLVPTALANTFRPQTSHGIPSVMCGFAVLMALILTLYITPRAAEPKILTKSAKHL
jgi:hypothetical protein